VALQSGDTKCEDFYKDVYVHIEDKDISKFCDVITNLIRSGMWKNTGERHYQIYKHEYDGVAIFDKCLLKFLKDFTSDVSLVNPMDEKYFTYIPKSLTRITFHQTINTTLDAIESRIKAIAEFDQKFDKVITTKLFQPIPDLNYDFVNTSNGSLNISLLDLQYKLQNQKVKVILIQHQYGVRTDMKTINIYIDEYEKQHGTRPIVIEDCSMIIDGEHKDIEIDNYQYLLEEMDEMIQTFLSKGIPIPFQLSFHTSAETKIGSPKFPLLLLDHSHNLMVDRFVNHLRFYNIDSDCIRGLGDDHIYGVVVPCGHYVTEVQLDYILDIIEEFFQISC
jgi:hypothetical protein